MWLCTEIGFFSIVQDQRNERFVWIRARSRGDLENLRDFVFFYLENESDTFSTAQTKQDYDELQRFMMKEVSRTPGRDYRYRMRCHRWVAGIIVGELVRAITATNFKGAIGASPTQASKLPAYFRFHDDMERWQRRNEGEPEPRPLSFGGFGGAPRIEWDDGL